MVTIRSIVALAPLLIILMILVTGPALAPSSVHRSHGGHASIGQQVQNGGHGRVGSHGGREKLRENSAAVSPIDRADGDQFNGASKPSGKGMKFWL